MPRNAKNVNVKSTGKVLAFFHRVLARCDTVHDFTKARALAAMRPPFSVDDIYATLDKIDALNASSLSTEFKRLAGGANPEITRDFEAILRNTTPRFVFLKAYALGGDSKRVGYEPSVVQFFEHFLGRYDLLDDFYLTTSERILRTCYVDYAGADVKSAVRLPPGKVCVMNLGHISKEEIGREASGIFGNGDVLRAFQSDLGEFFAGGGGADGVNFLVDASCVRHELFHNPEVGLTAVHTAASEWDSAHKFSFGHTLDLPALQLTREDSCGVLHAVDSLYVSLNPYGCAVNTEAVDMSLLPREVGTLLSCAQGLEDSNSRYRKAVANLDAAVFDPENPLDRLPWLFDIKRSGDGGQVLHAKTMSETLGGKFVLVTNDHLAFLKARMCGVPVVFTKRNGRTGAMMLVCVRERDNDTTAYTQLLGEALREESAELMAVCKEPAKIKESLEAVVRAFEVVADAIKQRFFLKDDAFKRAVYAALTQGVGGPAFDALTPRQSKDLDTIASRVQVYLLDFLAVREDLLVRLESVDDTLHTFEDLQKEGSSAKQFGFNLAVLRSKGYGPEAYSWCLVDDQVEAVLNKLEGVASAIENTSDEARLMDILNKHFFLEDSSVTQQALNFRPLHVFNDIWQFARHGFAKLSLKTSPRAETSATSRFEESLRVFVASREKALLSAAMVKDEDAIDIVRHQLDEAYALHGLYKEFVLEDSEQNSSGGEGQVERSVDIVQMGGENAVSDLDTRDLQNLEDLLYLEAIQDFQRVWPQLSTVGREEDIAPTESFEASDHKMEGGAKSHADLLQAVANDHAEVVLQICIISLSYVFLNGILVKHNDPKRPKNLALNILLNSGLTMTFLLVELQSNVKLYAFALYMAAVGYMVSKFM